jgi:alcohol dehydrogenase
MSTSYYEFFCPVKIIAGHSALEHIPFELATLGARRPLVLTDAGVHKAGLIALVETALKGGGVEVAATFSDVPPDSSLATVKAAAALYRNHNCDAILAVGGGSVIDTSKAVNILVSLGGDDLMAYAGAHNLPHPLKPQFVIPTTSGTGSEVTLAAVISDPERSVKLPFASYYLMPNATILDPRMTLTLPAHITAMTGMDAMTHAVESFTCMAANPISDAYATAAIQKIAGNLLTAIDEPGNTDARLELAQASTMAGIAFSNAMVGLVHALGHATGAVCHLPHGLCMNLYLPYALEFNKPVNGARIGELLLPLAGAETYAKTPPAQRAQATITTLRALRDTLHAKTQLPRTLQETGKVRRDQLDEIADRALNDGSIIFNPKEADLGQLKAILEKAWG